MRRRLTVDPDHTVASLIAKRQALHIRCIGCGIERYLSPLEALATYGGGLHVQEVTALLQARCGEKECGIAANPSIHPPDRMEVKRQGR